MPRCSRRSSLLSRAAALLVATAGLGPVAMLAAPAAATSVVPLTHDQRLAQADAVILGTVVGVETVWSDQRQLFANTRYTIRVDQLIADSTGNVSAKIHAGVITLDFAGGTINGTTYNVFGVPTFGMNEQAFLLLADSDFGSISPAVGVFQGLYRVRQAFDGTTTVWQEANCCGGPPAPMNARFLSKFVDPAFTYTTEAFAAELARAYPLARARADLRQINHGQGTQAGACTVNSTPQAGLPSVPATHVGPKPWDNLPTPNRPREFTPVTLTPVNRPQGQEYGFYRNGPSPNIPYNVTTAMNAPLRNAFIDQEGYWNVYTPGIYRLYTNQDNTIGWPNGRNEAAFLTSAQTNNLYSYTWGANTLGINFARWSGGPIIETDICFNPAFSFSANPIDTFNNSNVFSFRQVALHELGHSHGREHSWITNPAYGFPSTMNYFSNGYFQAEAGKVFADDSAGLRAMYPGSAANIMDYGLYLWSMTGALNSSGQNGARNITMPGSVLQGTSFNYSLGFYENVGTQTRANTVDFYLTTTRLDYSTAGAIYCSSGNLNALASFAGGGIAGTVNVPANTPPGVYYLLAAVPQGDAWNFNNWSWSNNTITVQPNPAFAPPANDLRANARPIGLGTQFGSTQFATTDGSAPCVASSGKDVWFIFTAPYAGTLQIDTCGTAWDTVVSLESRVFDPNQFRFVFVPSGCNDDQGPSGPCPSSNRASNVSTSVANNQQVRIRLGGFNNANGNYQMNVRVIPANDACSQAVPVGPGASFGRTTGATASLNIVDCGSSAATPDIWFTYTPSCFGDVVIDTLGSDFDTVLSVWTGCPGGTTTSSFDCNDDFAPPARWSRLVRTGFPGNPLLIRVSGFSGATGNVQLNITPPTPPNGTCATALAIADSSNSFDLGCAPSGSIATPLTCGGFLPVSELWYAYTAPVTGTASIQVDTSSIVDLAFDAAVSVFAAGPCPSDPNSALTCGSLTAANQTPLQFGTVAGQTYLVRMGGVPGSPNGGRGRGRVVFTSVAAPPSNDDCANAIELTSDVLVSGSLEFATNDGACSLDQAPGAPDVWYQFTAPGPGSIAVRMCGTIGLGGPSTVLSIHPAGECPGTASNQIAASDSALAGCPADLPGDEQDAQIGIPTVTGTTYLIRVAAKSPALVNNGTFQIRLEFVRSNTDCTADAALNDGNNLFSTANSFASGSVDSCFTDPNANDVWYKYTASCSGSTRISTCAQPYATALAIYTACPIGEPIACSQGTGPDCSTGQASVDFNSVAGATYFVRIGGIVPDVQTLTVTCSASTPTCRPDYNADGVLNTDDISDYITDYFTLPAVPGPGGSAIPCPGADAPYDSLGYKADYNQDCIVNTDDISDFITDYFNPPTGC